MSVPDEFKKLARGFYQGSHKFYSTEDEWMRSRLACLSAKEQTVVKQFLSELLAPAVGGKQLQEAWNSGDPDYCFRDPDLRVFLTMLRDMIE